MMMKFGIIKINDDIALIVFGLLIAIAFWPGAIYGGQVLRWALIAIGPALIFIVYPRSINITLIHLVGFIFLLWLFITLAWTANIYDGLDIVLKLFFLAQVFVLGGRLLATRPIIIGFAIGLWLSSGIAVLQWIIPNAGYQGLVLDQWVWPRTAGYAGLFVNDATFAWVLVLTIVAALTLYLWWLIPGLLVGLFLLDSRVAWLSLGVTFVAWIWSKSRLLASVLTICMCLIGLVLYELGYKSAGTFERIDIWKDTINGFSLFGHGLGSFSTLFPQFADHIDTFTFKAIHAHSDILELIFETGFIGFGLALIFFTLLISTQSNSRFVIIAFIVIAAFAFPIYLPATAFLAALFAGRIACCRQPLRNELNSFRMALQCRFINFKRSIVYL